MEVEVKRNQLQEQLISENIIENNQLKEDQVLERKKDVNSFDFRKFIQNERDNQQINIQFTQLYFTRLIQMKQQLRQFLLGQEMNISENIITFQNDEFLIASIFKEQKLKFNILKPNQNIDLSDLKSDDDQIYAEDETGRIKIFLHQNSEFYDTNGDLSPLKNQILVTGMVVAIQGYMHDNMLKVQRIVFMGFPAQDNQNKIEQIQQIITTPKKFRYNNQYQLSDYIQKGLFPESQFILITSGIIFSEINNNELYLYLLALFLEGQLGGDFEKKLSSRINKVIVAGNISSDRKDFELDILGVAKIKLSQFQQISNKVKSELTKLDDYFFKISQNIEVDIMPGENDPSNALFPQQPLNPCYFPKCYRKSNLSCKTNPYNFVHNGMEFLGTSGFNVKDQQRCGYIGEKNSDLEVMEFNLFQAHLSPTSPDTSLSYPFSDKDKFYLEKLPHVYFTGDSQVFDSKLICPQNQKVCRLIAVPSFTKLRSVALLNTTTLDCFEFKFDCKL